MIDQLDIIEIALRGAAAGINLLIAGHIIMSRAPRPRRWLGALFAFGTAAYILVSSTEPIEIFGPFEDIAKIFAIFNAVFFWWFALSLFEDDFRWTAFKIAPFLAIVVLHLPGPLSMAAHATPVEQVLHSSLSIGLMVHAIWVALHDRADDLVNPRRRFRIFFAIAVGVTGIVIGIAENIRVFYQLPEGVTFFHSAALAALTFFFAFWLLSTNRALFGPVNLVEPAPTGGEVLPRDRARRPASVADQHSLDKLAALMNAGVYLEEGLTVAALAEKVGTPEHQLRRLINREMGFRNFSAFLNERRIADAKTQLSDPAMAKKQVLQIALDLGYGSIAPFNRAFKSATGKTPTEFRREMLSGD